jgi:glutathione synthase/RimK-type ligase-like ATP-grasp enzyme
MVLCLTHSGDYYTIDIVQHYLQLAGIPSFRLNADELGVRYRLSYDLHDCYLNDGEQTVRASQIEAVWYRKLWELKIPEELDPAWKETFLKEYSIYRRIFFNAVRHVPWMNKMEKDHAVSNDKLWQLSAAKEAGLTVPATIFTNDAATIGKFFFLCGGHVVMKLHGSLSRTMSGNALFFPTTRLQESDLQHLDQLAYCPMIFQEHIPKAYELRIAYVAGEFFTGKIPAAAEPATDWRTISAGAIQWQRYVLPKSVCEKISRMMKNLDLLFGAIDMIRHPNGDYIFLEINPQGEWGMLQKHLDYPIGETIAEKLITAFDP